MPTVWIVNESGHDFSDAYRFGQPRFVTTGLIPKYDINHMLRLAAHSLKDSEPDDYILLTSLSSLCSVVCSAFSRKHGRLNLLIYKDGGYVERKVILDDALLAADNDKG